jgi:predicted nucleotidyltransferase
MLAMSIFTPEQRLATTEQQCDLLRADARLEGAVLVGSMAREPDRWSDIDLAAVVAGGREDGEAVATDWDDRMYEDFAAVHHYEVAFGDTLVRGFLLESLLEIDPAFSPLDSFVAWGPAELVFDRGDTVRKAIESPAPWEPSAPEWTGAAGFAWHDILHAGIAMKRGRLWQGLWYMERVRNRTLALKAIDRATKLVELEAKLRGELQTGSQIVCRSLDIPCIRLTELISQEGWRF